MLVVILGCQSMPTVTRTGAMKEVLIQDQLSDPELTADVGDEIRWVNKRLATVRITFLDPLSERLSCRNNLGNWLGGGTQTATLNASETASACFNEPGYVRYTVHMKSLLPSGDLNMTGVIKIRHARPISN
jgi:plastocyanin